MKMNIQYFAEGGEGGDGGNQQSSAAPTAEQFQEMQASMAELQKRLNNVSKQRDGLLAKQGSNANSGAQSSSNASNASSSQSASSAAPASSSTANDDVLASMEAQIAEMQKQNQELTSQITANKQRKSFLSQAKKDGIELTDQDLTMISNPNNQDDTYKYIKGLKANSKGRQYAPNANIFNRKKDNIGATIAQVDNRAAGLGALIQSQDTNKGVN